MPGLRHGVTAIPINNWLGTVCTIMNKRNNLFILRSSQSSLFVRPFRKKPVLGRGLEAKTILSSSDFFLSSVFERYYVLSYIKERVCLLRTTVGV